jgi:hypothetical protein
MRAALLLAVTGLAATALPAAAGPQGSGLWHTEAVAREAASTVTIRHRDAACLSAAAEALAGQPEVRKIAVGRTRLRVSKPTPARAAQATTQVRSAVAAACAAPAAVAGPGQAAADAPASSVSGS